jgi:hypothetical protein
VSLFASRPSFSFQGNYTLSFLLIMWNAPSLQESLIFFGHSPQFEPLANSLGNWLL